MADTKITDLTAITGGSLADGDQFVVVDVSDTTMASSGTNKKLAKSELAALFEAAGAVAAHAGASDPHPTYTTAAELAAALASYLTTAAAAAGYQPLAADLTAIAALASAANKVPYSTGSGSWSLADLTAAGRALIDDADAAAQRTTLGLGTMATATATDYVTVAQSINAQTGTTYTLVAGDAGKLVTLSNASAITLTVPQDSDATIAVGTYVDLYQLGAGQVTVAAGTGATLRTSGLTAKARAQYSRLGVQKVSANTWSLFGDLAAS